MSAYTKSLTSHKDLKISKVCIIFLLSILLSLWSISNVNSFNPLWILLVLIYCLIRQDANSFNSSLTYVFALGLLCDFISNRYLGITSITFLIVSYIFSFFKPKIYFYTSLQIFILVGTLLIINQTIFLIYYIFLGEFKNITIISFFAPVIMSLILWPILEFLLDKLFFRVSK